MNLRKEPQLTTIDKEKIIGSLIDEKKAGETYIYQKNGLLRVFTALEKNEQLSVELIKEFHALASTPENYSEEYIAPELRVTQVNPGKFRNRIVGTTIGFGTNTSNITTENGILEIISLLEQETKEGFDTYKGTWIGPHDSKTKNLSLSESVRHDNLAQTLQESHLSKTTLAQKIQDDMQERPYSYLYPRHNANHSCIQNYMEDKMKRLVRSFNKEMELKKDFEETKKSIVGFIKQCIRLHPFDDLNHRTFALCVFNFLLLRHNIGYCALKDRRIFIFTGINETLERVNPVITPLTYFKKSIISEINKYHSSYKLRIFGHHHNKREAEVKTKILAANSAEQIREILQNQYDQFFNPSAVTPTSCLSERYSLLKNLKNRNKGGYSTAIEHAVDAFNALQSEQTMKITKSI